MKNRVHIIGGGINGLCTAWYLLESGFEVTIIDKTDLLDGTSFGNAGMIVPSHFIPLASPGVIAKGFKWMFSSKSPFYIKPKLDLDLLLWTWKFYRSSTPDHVRNSSNALLAFNQWSKKLYKSFSELDEFSFGFENKGLLMLYRTLKQEKEELEFADMAGDLGIAVNKYNASELNEMEDVTVDALGGILFPGDAHISPSNFMQEMIHNLKRKGVGFVTGEELISINASGDKVSSIQTTSHDIPIEILVITGGSWTSNLLKFLKIKLLLQPGKGYSITYAKHNPMPKYPTILTEGKVAVTPLGQYLRIGGTLELGSFDNRINKNRLQGIKESMMLYYPNIDLPAVENKIWVGYRPCSPDGLPYIGRVIPFNNLYIGTGQGMMGMSMGPATGKLLSQIIANEDRDLKFELIFSLNR